KSRRSGGSPDQTRPPNPVGAAEAATASPCGNRAFHRSHGIRVCGLGRGFRRSYKSQPGGQAGSCRIVASRRQSHHRLTVFPLEMQFRTLAPGVPNPITMLSRATGALLLQTIPESPETFGTWLMRLLLRIAGRPPLAHMPRLFAPPSGLIPETRFRET